MKPLDQLHPEIAQAVEGMAVEMNDEFVAVVRSYEMPRPLLSGAVECTEHRVPGEPELRARVHRPKGVDGALPCVYWIHGGGYVIGTCDMDDARLDDWCRTLGVVAVSVEYRLAPEYPYPVPLEDCHRGLVWTFQHALEFGIDAERVGIAGLSAGGGLAAALALLVRDRGEPSIAFQLLDSAMLDDRQITPSSQVDGLPLWSRESNTYGWRSYLGERHGTDDLPYTAAAARAEDLAGLPPAFVSVGAVDGFLDENVEYALRLSHAGIPAELHVYPGACHGYQVVSDCEITRQSERDQQEWLARQLRR